MWSGVRKSGWPMPRLMMSRPWAASSVARASTAKAFSSPMRSNAAMVFSMGLPPGWLPPRWRGGIAHGGQGRYGLVIDVAVEIAILLELFLLNGFFAMAELAVVSSRNH